MMTLTHLLVTRRVAKSVFPGDRRARLAACAGSVWPDLYYWGRGGWLTVMSGRFDPAFVDAGQETRWPDKVLHSLLPPGALLAAAAARRNRALVAFAAAWAAHNWTDIWLHDGSARPPAWPVSSWRLRSRLATDEPGHHAGLVLAVEALLCAASAMPAQHVKVPSRATPSRGTAGGRRAMRKAFRQDWRNVGTLWVTSDRSVRQLLDLAEVDWPNIARVAEAGAGTGAFTGRILDRLGPGAVVDVYERNRDLHQIVAGRFGADPRVRLHYDAGDMEAVLGRPDRAAAAVIRDACEDLIVSALPWTSMAEADRDRLLAMFGRCLRPGSGILVAIQYSRQQEPSFRRHFADVRHSRGRCGWPVLYRLAGPREAAV
jgi:phospholipid N-methyltransferase